MGVPPWAVCPLEGDVMVDPVVDREGNSYSRAAIEAHIELVGEVSPVTGNVLARSMLVENVALRDAIARLGEGGREPRGSLPALMTPPPDEPKKMRLPEVWSTCCCSAGRWCPQCAIAAFTLDVPPNTWPEDIHSAVYGGGGTFTHSLRVRVGMFFYANGAWQSEEMFHQLMQPRLSGAVSRADTRMLFRSCERGGSSQGGRQYTTNDARRGGSDVFLDGKMAPAGKFTPAFVRKMELWDEYTYGLAVGGGEMPTEEFRRWFMEDSQKCLDPRALAHLAKFGM